MTLSPPLTDPESDLTIFKDMPFEVVRFAKSDLFAFAPSDAIVAAIMLWGSSWHSRPAGSLTNDDRSLAKAAGYGRGAEAAWDAIRADALRGWVECSDGRLYHPVVAEKVREAWLSRLKHMHGTYLATFRQHNKRNPHDQREPMSFDDWLESGRPKGVKRDERRPVQEAFELDDGVLSRVTSANVTRDSASSHDDEAHESREKNTEGKGIEGKGIEGNLIHTTEVDSNFGDDAVFDLVKVTADLARKAGCPNTQPAKIADNMTVVREWLADGIDLAAIVVPIIDRFTLNKPDERVTVLRFFDNSVRKAQAVADAKGKPKRHEPTMGSAHGSRLKSKDGEDARIGSIRAQLNGKPEHSADVIALSFVDEREEQGDPITLIVTARSSFVASRVDRDTIRTIAEGVLSPHSVEVEVRVE